MHAVHDYYNAITSVAGRASGLAATEDLRILQVMPAMPLRTGRRAAQPEELAAARALLAVERRQVEALTLFARRMSHDLSNLVTVMRTYSELVLADVPPGGITHADVREIQRAADAMIDYIHRIVRFTKTAGGAPSAVPLDDVVVAALQESPLGECLHVETAAGSVVRMDASWLAEAVRELVANAQEAAPAGSVVRVRTWCESVAQAVVDGDMPIEAGAWTVLEVENEGPGFAAEVRESALDPFVTTKHAVRGAGFGLTVARSATWQAGGQLVIESGLALPGARVRVWLPVAGATGITPRDL